jgi:hypothetical protein
VRREKGGKRNGEHDEGRVDTFLKTMVNLKMWQYT